MQTGKKKQPQREPALFNHTQRQVIKATQCCLNYLLHCESKLGHNFGTVGNGTLHITVL